ncbi:MAG TPA: hypothetical protein VKY81_02560 [Natronosporangium sp.]|nr:hypothetical protein [Natronosporangium sp.]
MRRLLTPRWLLHHLLMIVLVAGMLGLAVWQLYRARSGNLLSWGYTLQWPVFAGFVVFIWAREVKLALAAGASDTPPEQSGARRERGGARRRPGTAPSADPGRATRRPVVTRRPPVYDDSGDPQLAAYNDYLAWLNAHPWARPADYPGPGRTSADPAATSGGPAGDRDRT